jgi:bifunctional DNA-binding transcriptional regulator/antitoxin component of YhaV-PrlF toxin-antitoxin module
MSLGRKGFGTNYATRATRKGQVLISQEIMRRLGIKPGRTRIEIIAALRLPDAALRLPDAAPMTIILKPRAKRRLPNDSR